MTAREFAKTWVLAPNRTLADADYDFAEAYAAQVWEEAAKIADKFYDDYRAQGNQWDDASAVGAEMIGDTLRARLANFPRPSQNPTVSSGVEGAHEGTTADKSVAQAESSLSSPPPAFCQCGKDWTDGTGWCQECHLERKSNGEAE